jgi:putative peptide zinc metalloprotease protein
MLVASVTTVIFNANPLLRYDGYYILSDWLEIPNLRQKSTEYALGLIKRHLFRVKATQPLPPPVQRVWLLTYAITSSIYRVFVGIMIIILVAFQIPILGVLMALGGVVTWILVPFYKTFKYLAIEPELHRKRGRATGYTLAFVAAVVVAIGVIRFPLNLDAVGIAEPAVREVVRAKTDGFVEQVVAKDGQWVNPGDVLVVCKSGELDARLRQARAQLASLQVQRDQAIKAGYDVRMYEGAIATAEDEIRDLKLDEEHLTVRAAIAGKLTAPNLHEMKGIFLPQGQEVAVVAQDEHLMVHTLLEQKDVEPVVGEMAKQVEVKLRFAGLIGRVYEGGKPVLLGAGRKDVRSASLLNVGGTETAADPQDPSKAHTPQFDVGVPLANPEGKFVAGQRAYVRFTLDKRPLIWHWKVRFLQLIQSQQSPWM